MKNRTLIFFVLFVISIGINAQDFLTGTTSNYSGINQVLANPSAAVDNRLKFDINLIGIDLDFNNSWLGVKRASLGKSYSSTWKNTTPNVPDNLFKNFVFYGSKKPKALMLETRILMPSFLIQLNQKNALAFTWSVRQIANMDGITDNLTNLFKNELGLNVTQNNPIIMKNSSAVQMSWAEYGLTYAAVLAEDKNYFLKFGITPKILQGLESGYAVIQNLDVLSSNKDTNSHFDGSFFIAHSQNLNGNSYTGKVKDFYHRVAKPTVGLDIGITYEYRPEHLGYKYKADGVHFSERRDLNKYKLKISASIVDIGKIKFKRDGISYDLNVHLNNTTMRPYLGLSSTRQFDSLINLNFGDPGRSDYFKILLPTSANLQADYCLSQKFYLNLNAHIGNFFQNNAYRVHNYSFVSFSPRFESYWLDVSIPVTYNTLSAQRAEDLMLGVNFKLGPLTLGTYNLKPLFKGNINSANGYFLLKFAIPYKHLYDIDKDGVKDKEDECPDVPGDKQFKGCPDTDHDKIPDKEDACPHQAGPAKFKGCPDTDDDGIPDSEDHCPDKKGTLQMHGCPDSDHDSIPDKEDKCPDIAGLKAFEGCPDTDHDSISDKEDECPQKFGLRKHKGCPDTDNDGIIDNLDSCATIAGIELYKGCPPPVVIPPAEKKILEKAYSSLEFATGNDVIKASSFPSLNALAKMLASHDSDWLIKLSGHTDNEGTAKENLLLSEKRAKSVAKYLMKKGVSKETILVEWFGQTRALVANTNKAAKQKNRRVEMTLISK